MTIKSSILSEKQKLFLSLFVQSEELTDTFYLTGGTALTGFYIPYRYSEDLDFFSEKEVEIPSLLVFLKSIKDRFGYEKFDLNTSFNRNLIQLIFKGEDLKLEFTHFPFPQVEKPRTIDGLRVDSLLDIAINKLFTIYQKPRIRDFMDLYTICQKQEYEVKNLTKKAKIKFDWHVDPLKLGSQFLQVKELKDYPKLIDKLEPKGWQSFFVEEARKLGKEILK